MQGAMGLLRFALVVTAFIAVVGNDVDDVTDHRPGHRHGKHHKHHKKNDKKAQHDGKAVVTKPQAVGVNSAVQAHSSIVDKMKKLEARLAEKAREQANVVAKGHLLVNGPLPADFNERFAQAVAQTTGVDAKKVKVTDSTALGDNSGVVEVAFQAPPKIVKSVEDGAANPDSKLAKGNMRPFLVAKSDEAPTEATVSFAAGETKSKAEVRAPQAADEEATPVEEKGIDIDTQMPYGDLEPFGREDTAQELTESSVKESDGMVDQLERAEVAEEKRSVFRALTRLRGAAITSFDGVARSQTGNIDEYNKVHKWRKTHPLHHLADEESDVSKWAFPDNADF